MAISKEDIKPGHYWVKNRKTGDIFDVEVWLISGALWVEGPEGGSEIDASLEWIDFISRIEPPEGM